MYYAPGWDTLLKNFVGCHDLDYVAVDAKIVRIDKCKIWNLNPDLSLDHVLY